MQWSSRFKENLIDLYVNTGQTVPKLLFEEDNNKELWKSVEDLRKEGNEKGILTNSTNASPP